MSANMSARSSKLSESRSVRVIALMSRALIQFWGNLQLEKTKKDLVSFFDPPATVVLTCLQQELETSVQAKEKEASTKKE